MSIQLKLQGLLDSRHKYLADGVVRFDEDKEILLLETSSAYSTATAEKISFDHHKGMFGLLSMMKTTADQYKYASFEIFRKLKLHFVHVHGTAVRHWTMSVPDSNIYLMCKEQRAEIPRKFADKGTQSLPFVLLYLNLAAAIQNSVETLSALEASHEEAVRKSRFQRRPEFASLREHVNPLIVRLSEGKHSRLVDEEGPQSLPGSPLY
ncbi:hypothetical protein DFQ30_008850 [Apophysomyces sp. BC1015]|nr:hypothetical protein DFQ30_008850 [Apophysomyces sp. BC1015]